MQNYNPAGTFSYYDILLKILSTVKSVFIIQNADRWLAERRCSNYYTIFHNYCISAAVIEQIEQYFTPLYRVA